MDLLNTAFCFYRRLLCGIFETAVLLTIWYASDWNIAVFLFMAGLIFVAHHLYFVLRELYPNSFIFREPTLWFFGVMTAFAMVLVGMGYALIYVRHYSIVFR